MGRLEPMAWARRRAWVKNGVVALCWARYLHYPCRIPGVHNSCTPQDSIVLMDKRLHPPKLMAQVPACHRPSPGDWREFTRVQVLQEVALRNQNGDLP